MLKHLRQNDVDELCEIAARRHGLEDLAHFDRIDPDDPSELLAIDKTRELTDQLAARIEKLSPLAQEELAALAWLGRGDEEGDFIDHLASAHKSNGERIAHYLAEKWPLGFYLQQGLAKLPKPTRNTDS